MKTHQHRLHTTRIVGFRGPVRTPENRAAHGNICEIATCRCGATRETNVNQDHFERGQWAESESAEQLIAWDL